MAIYEIVKTVTMNAAPADVLPLITNFRAWPRWSAWESEDSPLERTYTGPEQGVGAIYEWSGDKATGAGRMEITEATDRQVRVTLTFIRPFSSTAHHVFDLTGDDSGPTTVTWSMTSSASGFIGLLQRVFRMMERMLGKQIEQGLGKMKALAEAAT